MNKLEKNKIIEFLYNHVDINRLINSVDPEHVRDDLRQETFLALLSMPDDKISEIWASNGLVGFTIKIITNMAFSSTSPFYKKFRKNDYQKALDYQRSLQKLPELNIKFATIANKRLAVKYQEDELQAHEAILFTKYVELRSCKKVADFFTIPEKHVKDIIRKTKLELKNLCLNNKL
jgi:DNA-directed RNA polymerase specialized sigma24 family protein